VLSAIIKTYIKYRRYVLDSAIKKAIQVTEEQAQYDDSAKHLLGQKIILSHILARTVDEFKGMDPKDILPLIEGEPKIGTVPVDPGLTNATEEKNGERVTGLNTENSEVNEGLIRFDIVFYVRMRDGLAQIIVNVEAQKDAPGSYHLLNRAIFYVCRLVSSQKGRDFTKTNYDDMKRVYSIWICMDMKENSLSHVRLRQGQILGNYVWQGKLDMLNIVFIGLGNTLSPEGNKDYRLHRLLGALLSNDLSAGTKLDIMENEYDI